MLGLIFPLILYFDIFRFLRPAFPYTTRIVSLGLLAALFTLFLVSDLLRFFVPDFNRFYHRILSSLMKKEETSRFTATVPYFLASIILFLFFSRSAIMLASIFLILGDTAAAYFGGKYGTFRLPNGKSLAGLIAFVCCGFLFSALFLVLHTLGGGENLSLLISGEFRWTVLLAAFLGALLAALAELTASPALMGLIDDNMLVPLGGVLGLMGATLITAAPALSEVLFNPQNLIAF